MEPENLRMGDIRHLIEEINKAFMCVTVIRELVEIVRGQEHFNIRQTPRSLLYHRALCVPNVPRCFQTFAIMYCLHETIMSVRS